MSLWGKIRQGEILAGEPAARAAVEETDTKPERRLVCFLVEPPTITALGSDAWLPAAWRGLEVVHPAPNWELAGRSPMGAPDAMPPVDTHDLAGNGLVCLTCGCGLFWEPLGNPDARSCVECDPPSPRLVENLWLVECENLERRVSNVPRWQQAAFFQFEQKSGRRRAVDAATAKIRDEGF